VNIRAAFNADLAKSPRLSQSFVGGANRKELDNPTPEERPYVSVIAELAGANAGTNDRTDAVVSMARAQPT
jgi:hypothetical protein